MKPVIPEPGSPPPSPQTKKGRSAAERWAGQRWRDIPLGEEKPRAVPVARVAKPPLGGVTLRRTEDQRQSDVLRPSDLDPLKNLILFAQLVVEGWFSGKHRSVDFGTNAEFAEFTNYVQGDPVADIDWRAYARTRQLVIRKHREEKDMTGYLVVDVSGSMGYSVDGRDSKQLRAARIAASLAYLMQRQGDKSALAMFREDLAGHVPPGATRRHLHDVVSMLDRSLGASMGKTTAHGALDRCIPLFKKRGSVVVISDFFTDLDKFFDAIAQFQHRKFNILLLHVVDPDELNLPNVPLARFVDMETGEGMQVAPDEVRAAYQKEMAAMTARLEEESLRRGIDYRVLNTQDPYIEAIEAWLGLRGKVIAQKR